MEKRFVCENCKKVVPVNRNMGTWHRNQCPYCLWSKDVDVFKGDRKSACLGLMEPIGLTFKQEGIDRYGKTRQGELMIIHRCLECNKFSINRIAADDDTKAILELFEKSIKLPEAIKKEIEKENIRLLYEKDREEIRVQLFGRM